MYKILCFYGLDWEKEYLQKFLNNFQITFLQGTTRDHPELSISDADILCVFVDSPVDRKFLEKFSNLKLIATRSTGFNHLDLNAAHERDIQICYVPSYGKNTVAEYAFGLMIMVLRKLYDAYEQLRNGNFSRKNLVGSDLAGKTLGVVGTGDIGSHVVKIGTAFDMNVLAFDIKPNEQLVAQTGCTYVAFDELLAQSDIITLHVPYNKATHHLINMKSIKKIKKGNLLINTSRGPIIETAALVRGLQDDIFMGAGLDVLEEEGDMEHEVSLLLEEHPNAQILQTVLANHYLIEHPRVIVTPHNAFNTIEARKRILDCTMENIKDFFDGKTINIVMH